MDINVSILKKSLNKIDEVDISLTSDVLSSLQQDQFAWIDINTLNNNKQINTLSEFYKFHPVILEDILDRTQLPRYQKFGDNLFLTLKILNQSEDKLIANHISLLLLDNVVVTIHEDSDCRLLKTFKHDLISGKILLDYEKADYLFYQFLDLIVDDYFPMLREMAKYTNELEEKIINQQINNPIEEILLLKKDLLNLRKYIFPLQEALNRLVKIRTSVISEDRIIYFEDVHDKVSQIIEIKSDIKDMISTLFDINMSINSNKTNEIINLLTLVTSVFIPLSFLTGLYGMNFIWMPELEWKWSYPVFLLVSLVISVSMIGYMKKKKWF